MTRFYLDVNDARAALQQLVRLRIDGPPELELVLDVVDLDTGSTFALVGPSSALPPARVAAATPVWLTDAVGKRNKCKSFEGTLRFGDWDFGDRIQIVVHEGITRWMLGMPVLRRFDLLLVSGFLVFPDP